MPNDKFNFADWDNRWDDGFISSNRPKDSDYVSPYEAVVRERRLAKLRLEHPELKAVPVDYFVFGLGEPTNRATTKIGGVPYLPLSMEWPRNEFDDPYQFYAQVNFCDSRDIVGVIPNDILLIFSEDEPCLLDDFRFLWVADDPAQPTITKEAAKEFADIFTRNNKLMIPGEDAEIEQPLFAQIFRTTEVEFDDYPNPTDETTTHLTSGAVCASKIGGIDRMKNPSQIFRLETIGVHAGRPHPWLNREEAYTREELDGYFKTLFAIGDMGSICFVLGDHGMISIDCHSY